MKNTLCALALIVSFSSFGQTAKEYFDLAMEKFEKEDWYGAIFEFTKAIELKPDYDTAYNFRGLSKFKVTDYYSSISDFRKAIKFGADNREWLHYYYDNMGGAMLRLGDHKGALNCFEKAIIINSEYANAYLNRGNAKWNLDYPSSEVCEDYRMAAYRGSRRAEERIKNQCN